MIQIVEQTKEEKLVMYMKMSKRQLIEMLLECHEIIATKRKLSQKCKEPSDGYSVYLNNK